MTGLYPVSILAFMLRDKHSHFSPDAWSVNPASFIECKTAVATLGVSSAECADAFHRLAVAMRSCGDEWRQLFAYLDRHLNRRRTWYGRLRWRLDDLVKSWPRLSSLRSVRRFRLFVERLVIDIEGD